MSLEQKQKLCIARLIAVKPDVLLMDEPCSTLDPQATARIEELMRELKHNYTIIIVTHNMQQAARVSDDTGFMLLGEMVEFGSDRAAYSPRRKINGQKIILPEDTDNHKERYMQRHFDEQLKDLHQEILKMGVMAQEAIYRSIEALKDRDKAQAQEVIVNDKKIDHMENEIDEQCIDLIARYQPMAGDLRFIATAHED